MRSIARALATVALGGAVWAGCSEDASQPMPQSGPPSSPGEAPSTTPESGREPPEPSRKELIEAGRVAYNANCIACHSMDPTQDGALGPAVAGASLELLEARVLRAEYPPGYEPKRKTRVMVALPHLERQLPALAAYLDSLE